MPFIVTHYSLALFQLSYRRDIRCRNGRQYIRNILCIPQARSSDFSCSSSLNFVLVCRLSCPQHKRPQALSKIYPYYWPWKWQARVFCYYCGSSPYTWQLSTCIHGGFLLSRLSLSETSNWKDTQPFVKSHKRAVLLVIDALRFDFISPDPPQPPSPYHHNVLRLPAELTQKYPDRSFIYTSFADPPTTTLQRIKGITAGSLPTFIDMGSNFGGASNLEDSFISQLTAAGKRVRKSGLYVYS